MTVQKFKYKDVDREVLIIKEDADSITGYDLSKLTEEEKKETWRVATKDIDLSQMTEEQAKAEYQKCKEIHGIIRRFKKSAMK